MRYVRDMRGYGANPPDPQWPGGAHVAVQFVVNYEEGGENCVLHGDAASEAFLSEIVGAAALAGPAPLEHGIDLRIWRPRRLLAAAPHVHRSRGAGDLLRRRHRARALARPGRGDAGGRLGDRLARPEMDRLPRPRAEDERRDIDAAIRLHAEVTGERPTGWYTGRTSVNTVRLVAEEGGFDYVSDTYDDELPYWLDHDGHGNAIAPQLDHPLHARRQRHALRHAAGLQFRRPVLRLSEGQLRHALCRGQGGPAAHDEHRPALPAGRPARAGPRR